MKKRSFYLTAALLLTALIAVAAGCACTGAKTPTPSARPSASPLMPSASPSASPTKPQASAEASVSPSAGASEAAPSQGTDSITGFMEGGIVDPEDVPELTALIKRSAEYADMAVQSITYKLYEGRQAYYVVLQGEGDASHPIYVFADDSIVSAEMNGGD